MATQRPGFLSALIGDNGQKVEAKLNALQNANRLAVHVFEPPDELKAYPSNTLGDIRNNDGGDEQQLFSQNRLAMLSTTLLPQAGGGKIIEFFNMYGEVTPAYLMDLSNAKVAKVFPGDGDTGFGNFDKNLHLERQSGIPSIDTLYTQTDRDKHIASVLSDPQQSTRQLHYLAEHMRQSSDKKLPWNEVLIVPHVDQIVGITVPEFPPDANDTDQNINALKNIISKLKGLASGLAHAREGMEIPVMMYHWNEAKRGQLTYVAQGERECTTEIMKTIEQMQSNPDFADVCANRRVTVGTSLVAIKLQIQSLLGIDITKPIQKSREVS